MAEQIAMSMPTTSLMKQFAVAGKGKAYQEIVFD